MARVVRKVSTAATAGQKKQLSKKAKLWIIIGSCILGALAIAGAVVGIVFAVNNANSSSDDDDYTYTFTSADTTEGREIAFEKTTASGVTMYTNSIAHDPLSNASMYVEHVFVFAYYSNSFCPDSAEDDYNKIHAQIVTRLADLQYSLSDLSNCKLYIIDLSVGDNATLIGDEDVTMAFYYYEDGEQKDTASITADKEAKVTISSTSMDTIYNTCISNAIRKVEYLKNN